MKDQEDTYRLTHSGIIRITDRISLRRLTGKILTQKNTKGEHTIMKKALTAGLMLAGVLAVSGTSFAVTHAVPKLLTGDKGGSELRQGQNSLPEPPRKYDAYDTYNAYDTKRPPHVSRDKRPHLPPDKRHPRMSGDKRPPMPPRSDDRRPPEHRRRNDNTRHGY